MDDILAKICRDKREHVEARKHKLSESVLRSQLGDLPPPRGFLKALQNKAQTETPALIAEIKKASPSKGLIREDFEPVFIADAYHKAGAAALSILTDTHYFQGKDSYIAEVKENIPLPVLRKDFMLDPYQITESRAIGADCVLLIMAALSDSQSKELYEAARILDLDILVEVHNREELERALAIDPMMIGVNNRNLKTLEIDLEIGRTLAAQIPETTFKIAESGIYEHSDITGFQACGFQAFLVGESLMRQENIEQATKNLLRGN